jgi:glycosyltransferase involved in cell wall biosynthesis
MVDEMNEQFEFWILTNDRDAGDLVPYANVMVNAWNQVGNAQVYYASPDSLSFNKIRELIRDVSPRVVYLNSFFYPLTLKYLICRRLRSVPTIPTVIAPHGEFLSGALKLKAFKKRIYIALASRLGLYDGLTWQATSSIEEADIRATWGSTIKLHFAPYLLKRDELLKGSRHAYPPKRPGLMKLVFLSRISPKKNLLFALQLLQKINGQVIFDIYGPLEDREYWKSCQKVISATPDNIRVSYNGSIPNEQISETLSNYHFFFLPSLGENFGHAILEALSAWCPVIVSDQTPWRDLAKRGVGWDLPLEAVEQWQLILQSCIDMDHETYQKIASQARQLAVESVCQPDLIEKNISLFTNALDTSCLT